MEGFSNLGDSMILSCKYRYDFFFPHITQVRIIQENYFSRGFHQEDDNIHILLSINNQSYIDLSAICTGHARLKAT